MPPPRRRRLKLVVLALLASSFLAPLFLFHRVPAADVYFFIARREFDKEGTRRVKNLYSGKASDGMRLNALAQEVGGEKQPEGVVYKDEVPEVMGSAPSKNQSIHVDAGDGRIRTNHRSPSDGREDKYQGAMTRFRSHPSTTDKLKEMKDQIIMAKTYLQFSSPNSKSRLLRQLKLRIKDIQRILDQANSDSDLSRSHLQKMKAMDIVLSKAGKAYPDCFALASKLRAQLYDAEEQVRAQQNQASYLLHVTARTFPKGLHCLSMRLTTDFFALKPKDRELPNIDKVHNSDLYHYAIFSDNVVACAVAVNSTITTAVEPEKVVFHVVTDSINFPAMVMWFLSNPSGGAAVDIQSLDDFQFLPAGFSVMFMNPSYADPRYTSLLNHLRFYLPDMFPSLNKILLLDHDVVVQRDLRELWAVDMKGKVNGAVNTCKEGMPSHKLEMLVNFSDPIIAKFFDAKACVWGFGMNMFDLQEWRRQGLTGIYQKWVQLGKSRKLWSAGTLPLGQLLFYNHTVALDWQWHVPGLGHESGVEMAEIERAAVVHYDGNMKPWLDIAIPKYKRYWTRFLDYSNPYFQQCNIHE
ncbi:probable galacturonosyltransferase 5 [Zingiber officinale]|uniref:probable galacturonosyltransferase 5 n=1 Tax=Zingiber officinale TaxID=94328 RepID=UPI001C4BAAAD|nr:probable galacturonosyltransferase 5 [Zingiber officinale]